MKTKIAALCVALTCCMVLVSCGDDYGKILTNQWKRVFELNGNYQWSGYPVDNFGVATAYDPPKGKAWADGDRLCATWTCLGVKPEDIPKEPATLLSVNGYADTGSGGIVTLSETQKKELGLSVLLPGLANVLDMKAKLDWSKGVDTTLTLGKAYKRSLIRPKMAQYINGLKAPDPLKAAFDRGDLVLIVADLVVDSLRATIKVNSNTNADVEAKLKGKAEQLLGSGASGTFKLARQGTGDYSLEVTQPVVLAVLPRKQPGPQVLKAFTESEKEKWLDWSLVTTGQSRPDEATAPKGLLPLR